MSGLLAGPADFARQSVRHVPSRRRGDGAHFVECGRPLPHRLDHSGFRLLVGSNGGNFGLTYQLAQETRVCGNHEAPQVPEDVQRRLVFSDELLHAVHDLVDGGFGLLGDWTRMGWLLRPQADDRLDGTVVLGAVQLEKQVGIDLR